ncbi:electron transfer flavoprotein subunit beta/FixA family protein [Chloroflexota bacterium]
MPLDIVVCIKQVPDPEHFSEITLDPVSQVIRREGIPSIINPLDKHALEEGLRIRERFSGKVTAISMGPPQVREALEETLAMGVDDAVLLCDRAFAGADTLATAYVLAAGVQKLGRFDLILCGNETVDGATGQVGPQLAELLDIPHVTYVNEVEFIDEGALIARQALEHGYLKVQVKLPALIAVTKEINQFRLPTVLAIMKAAGREIRTWGCDDTEVERDTIGLGGSPTQVVGVFEHKFKRRGEILEGSPEEVAKKAITRLRELGAI